MKKKITLVLIVVLVALAAIVLVRNDRNPEAVVDTTTAAPTSNPAIDAGSASESFDKKTYSTTNPNSIWVVVNKKHPLSVLEYTPSDLVTPNVPLRVPGNESMRLRQEAAQAVEKMFSAAKKDGINLMVSSGHRSYSYQASLYNGYVQSSGQAFADTISARPGHSEHQTGLAFDVEPTSRKCEIVQCFEDTPEGMWVNKNAHKHGFIIRYTPSKEAITGYSSEPWHLRYVGELLANELHSLGVETLEEFFGISGGDYS